VAVVRGSYAAERLPQEQAGMELLLVDTELACVEAVHLRKANACIESGLVSQHNILDLQVRQTSPAFWFRPYVFGVRKGNAELLAWLNRQLSAMHKDGSYFSIYQRWKPKLEWRQPTLADHLPVLAWITIPLLLLAFGGLAVSRYLKYQVAERTRQIQYQAAHDGLTGLLSPTAYRNHFSRRLEAEPAWRPTVVFLRLQSLESVAHLFGHKGFEKLIVDFAQHVKTLGFPLAAHFGAGFCLLAAEPGTSAEHIYRQLSTSCRISDIQVDPGVVMGVSAGIPGLDTAPIKPAEYTRQAMLACALAVREKKPWCHYTSDLEADPRDLILLHDAQHYGCRDMYLLYQPKVDLASGYLYEAEALIRWQHPTLGVLSPGYFIPLLEKTGLIHRLTRWVVEEAVSELIRCRRYVPEFSISINISSHDLVDESLVDFIISEFSPEVRQGLCLEITETGLINDLERAREVIATLRRAGIRCAIDDFGAGYGSMMYLNKFEVDEIKLDRSYVCHMLDNPRDRSIVTSAIGLAHSLGLKVTAEGVEDIATLQALGSMGCDTAQGYVIAQPLKAEALYDLIGQPCYSPSQGGDR